MIQSNLSLMVQGKKFGFIPQAQRFNSYQFGIAQQNTKMANAAFNLALMNSPELSLRYRRCDLIEKVSERLAYGQITDWRRWMSYGGIRREICLRAMDRLGVTY